MVQASDALLANLGEHVSIFLAGSTALGIVSHAVNTFPAPTSPFGKWLLGVIQYIVGQRVQGEKTMNGKTPGDPPKDV